MKRFLLLTLPLLMSLNMLALASIKITFSGDESYVVNIEGSKYSVDDQYLQLDNMIEGNYSLKFSVRHGMTTILVHTTYVYLQNNTETIAIFEDNVLKVKAVNQLNNVVINGNSGWSNSNYFSDADFLAVLNEIEDESFDSNKKDKIISLIKNGMISTEQGRQLLETFSFDSERYEAAIGMVSYIYDSQNLWQLGETFSFSSNKDSFLEYIDNNVSNSNQGNTWNTNNNWNQTAMDENSFSKLLKSVEDEAFDTNKPGLILNSVKYSKISTQQAIRLLETFSFDSHRLDAAKEMTPYVYDRHNYWQAGETFDFNSNKEDFLKFIQ